MAANDIWLRDSRLAAYDLTRWLCFCTCSLQTPLTRRKRTRLHELLNISGHDAAAQAGRRGVSNIHPRLPCQLPRIWAGHHPAACSCEYIIFVNQINRNLARLRQSVCTGAARREQWDSQRQVEALQHWDVEPT